MPTIFIKDNDAIFVHTLQWSKIKFNLTWIVCSNAESVSRVQTRKQRERGEEEGN